MVTELADRKLLFLVMTSCTNIMSLWPTLPFIEIKGKQWKSADIDVFLCPNTYLIQSHKGQRRFFSFQAFNFDNWKTVIT